MVGFCFLYTEVMFSCVKDGQTAFRDFLKAEFCEENLDFWLTCQEFKNFNSREELTWRAASIYEEFIGDESPRQVNYTLYWINQIIRGVFLCRKICLNVSTE